MSWHRTFRGMQEFVFGLFKKVFIADHLALFVDPIFTNCGAFNSATVWLAVAAYAVQIYCDFSGYSDMAIGVARMLGYDLRSNFNLPYISRSVEEFWRRWHISLSSWLRDYLYIPLGGNRLGRRRTYINLMLTMLLGGLWHGAAWTFVAWGAWHGAALVACRFLRERGLLSSRQKSGGRRTWLPAVGGWCVTILIVLVGWVFFRAQTFGDAGDILRKMFLCTGGIGWYHPFTLFLLTAVALRHLCHVVGADRLFELPADSVMAPVVLFSMIWLTIVFFPQGFQPFIYFRF